MTAEKWWHAAACRELASGLGLTDLPIESRDRLIPDERQADIYALDILEYVGKPVDGAGFQFLAGDHGDAGGRLAHHLLEAGRGHDHRVEVGRRAGGDTFGVGRADRQWQGKGDQGALRERFSEGHVVGFWN